MTDIPTNLPKHTATPNNKTKTGIAVWDDQDVKWDDTFFYWDIQSLGVTNKAKHIAIATNKTKS